MLSAVLGGLFLGALWIAGDLAEDVSLRFAERLGIGTIRIVTVGRSPGATPNQAVRLLAAAIGIVECVGAAIGAVYLISG